MATTQTFGFSTTTNQVLEGIDLTGKTVLITGGSDGLGKETARALASKGADITIVARNAEKLTTAASEITASTNAKIETSILELDKPESVKQFAKAWIQTHSKLDILINNAGIMACPETKTPEGWELQFATNHLGHFLLTNLLMPTLKASENARIVHLSSGGHRFSPVTFEDVNFTKREYDPMIAYGQSKTANVWFSNELDRRFKTENIRSFAVEPGAIKTSLGRLMDQELLNNMMDMIESNNMMKTVEQGAATTVWAATDPSLNGKGGLFLGDCQIRTEAKDATQLNEDGYAPHAFNEDDEKQLWELSNQLLKTSF